MVASEPESPLEASGFASAAASEGRDPASSAYWPCVVSLGVRGPFDRPSSPGGEGRTVRKQQQWPSRPPALVRCHSSVPSAQAHRSSAGSSFAGVHLRVHSVLVGNAVAMGRWVRFGERSEVGVVPGHWWAMPSTRRGHRRLVGRFDMDRGCAKTRAGVAHEPVGIEEDTP